MDASLLAARVQGPSIVQTHEAREMHSSVGHVPFNAGPVNAGLWSPDVAHPKQSSTSDAPPTPDCFDHPMLDPRGHSEVEVKALSRKCRGVNPVAARSPALFGFLWRQAFPLSDDTFCKVVVVGSSTELLEWRATLETRASVGKNANGKKKKKKNKQNVGDDEDWYHIDWSLEDGEIMVLLPGVYCATAIFAEELGDCDVLVIGLGQVIIFSDDDNDESGLSLIEGGRACFVNVRFEARGAHPPSCAEIQAGGALRLVDCSIGPLRKLKCPDRYWGEDFDQGLGETYELILVTDGGVLCAELCRFGPSTRSAVFLDGPCAIVLRLCVLSGNGRGNKVQRVNRITGQGPCAPEGRWPAIAVSHAASLTLTDCVFEGNCGYPVQFTNLDEQDGTTGMEAADSGMSPNDVAADLVSRRVDMVRENPDVFQFGIFAAFDLTTPDGVEAAREHEIHYQLQLVEEAKLRRVPGRVQISGCRSTRNGTSRYIDNVPTLPGVVEVQPWFAKDSPMGAIVGDAFEHEDGASFAGQQYDSAETREDLVAGDKYLRKLTMKPLAARSQDETAMTAAERMLEMMATDPEIKAGIPGGSGDKHRSAKSLFVEDQMEDVPRKRYNFDDKSKASTAEVIKQSDQHWELRCAAAAAFHELDEGAIRKLRLRIDRDFDQRLEKVIKHCLPFLSGADVAVDLDELRHICWGVLARTGPNMHGLAATFAIAALEAENMDVSFDRYRILVRRLECDNLAERGREFSDSCNCDSRSRAGAMALLEMLGGRDDRPGLVDALFELLGDTSNGSEHGRQNAAKVLTIVAQRRLELRAPVIDAIAAALISGDPNTCHERFLEVELVGCLKDLLAKECCVIVRKAFKKGYVGNYDHGDDYVSYLQAVGLEIDPADAVVDEDISHGRSWCFSRQSEERLRENAERFRQTRLKKATEHNTKIARQPGGSVAATKMCGHCGVAPAAGERFKKCARCEAVFYCGPECQKAAWKLHKRACKPRVAAPVAEPIPLVEQFLQAESTSSCDMLRFQGKTPRETIKYLNMEEDQLFEGLAVGDWNGVFARMFRSVQTVRALNDSPLRSGDRVEIIAGNHVRWAYVGKMGMIMDRHKAPDVLGEQVWDWSVDIDFVSDDDVIVINERNLKRV